MSKEFNGYIHSWVLFEPKHGLEVGSFEGPCPIVHHTGDRVWVAATYADLPFCKEIDGVQVGDGLSKGFDEQGNCVVSIAVKHVSSYLDDEEAECAARCLQIDRDMLANAQ
jgi:hypothetical protein